MKENSFVYLRLYHEYIIFDIKNKKLLQQRVNFFKILQKIDLLIYRFELSSIIIIHFVVSIIMFESISINENLYYKSKLNQKRSLFVTIKYDDDSTFYYEIERLLNKRIFKNKIQYFVK